MRADRGSDALGAGPVREVLRDRTLIAYATLSVVLSWAWWVPVALTGGTASHFPGLVGPMVAAVMVTAARGGRPELRRLRGSLGAVRWWALALTPLLLGAIAAAVVHLLGDGPPAGDFAVMPGVPAWSWPAVLLVLLVVGGLGEEVGWRGLAWTRLRRRLGLRDAALVLTVPWALWHLPLFWIDSGLADLPLVALPGWLLGLASGSVVLGWLYERSGSLLVAALAHTAVNIASGTRGSEGMVAAVVSVGVIAAAMAVLAADRRAAGGPAASTLPGEARGSAWPEGRGPFGDPGVRSVRDEGDVPPWPGHLRRSPPRAAGPRAGRRPAARQPSPRGIRRRGRSPRSTPPAPPPAG